MKIAYFDCFSGISGDMILGALIDAGLDFSALKDALAKLRVPGFELERKKVERHHIVGTKLEVITGHEHAHRGLTDIIAILDGSDISVSAKTKAKSIFTRLAEAEAKVHGTTPDEIHFHEVGAIDAIVDIVGAVIGIELLGVEQVFASTLRLGTGVTQAAHGVIPIPAPATVELIKNVPVARTDIPAELVTPTGAAIITTLASGFGSAPVFQPEAVGYGAGGRDLSEVPNLLRVCIGERRASFEEDHSIIIETNIDDMTPEIYGYIVDKLLEVGAKDAYLTPVIMKKARPGIVLTVLTDHLSLDRTVRTIFEETTTLGVRIYNVDRKKVARSAGDVQTRYGTVRTKIAEFEGKRRETPEYDDCVTLAREHGVPLLDVYRAAECNANAQPQK